MTFLFVAVMPMVLAHTGEDHPGNIVGGGFVVIDKDYDLYYTITKKAANGKPGTAIVSDYFSEKDGLSINIPEYATSNYIGCKYKVTGIKEGAFELANIKTVTLSKYITSIGDYAFDSSNIKSITIPKTVKKMGVGVFFNCHNLTKISVAKDSEYFSVSNGFLMNKKKTILYATTVKTDNFLTVPSTVVDIKDYALSNVYFKSERDNDYYMIQRITYPATVKTIGKGNMNALILVFKGSAPKISDTAKDITFVIAPKKYVANFKKIAYDGSIVFNTLRVIDKVKYYDSNSKFLSKLDSKKYLKKQSSAITKKANEITKGLKTEKEKALMITNWILDNIKYDSLELIYSKDFTKAENVLKNLSGGDNGRYNLLVALCNAVNIPCVIVSNGDSNGKYANVLLGLAYIDDSWIPIRLESIYRDLPENRYFYQDLYFTSLSFEFSLYNWTK